jgi:hypothetical protein
MMLHGKVLLLDVDQIVKGIGPTFVGWLKMTFGSSIQ